MKKFFIFYLMAFIACGCVSTKTFVETCYGSVTTFTPQGDTLKRWENAFIEEETTTISTSSIYGSSSYQAKTATAFKAFGLNFIDLNTGKGVIVQKDIPFIIEYNSSVNEIENKKISAETGIKDDDNIKAEKILVQYHNCEKQIKQNKKEMKTLDKHSQEYAIKKEQNDELRAKMRDLDNQYQDITGSYIYMYYDM